MPLYTFEHIKTKRTKDVFFHMNDEKIFNGDDGDEIGEWRRVYTVPQGSIDTKIDPFSEKQFVERTATKTKTMGGIWDYSKELSEKRAEKNGGVDPQKQKYFDKQRKKRSGKASFHELKDKAEKASKETYKIG